MSAISLKSITGITSITTPAGVDNQLTLHNNNTTEAVKLDIAGNLHFHNHLNITGVSTASNFKTGTSNLHNTGLNVFDLDVDGHTNLDNVSIVGIITASQGLKINVSPAITIRDGTTEKGYIGFNANDPFIGRKNGVGLAFQNNKVRPVDGDDGSPSNNTIDLGEPTYRFKDGYFAGSLDIEGDIDVNGHTNLDNVNISGVTTHTGTTNLYGNGAASAVWGDTGYSGHLSFDGSNNPVIRAASGKALIFQTNHVNERLRIDSSGRLLIGTTSSRETRAGASGYHAQLQLESEAEAAFSVTRFGGVHPSRINLQHARGTISSIAAAQNGDNLGQITFSGWDGDTFTNGAEVISNVDGAPGDDDMPGNLLVKTTPNGSAVPEERLRITSAGKLLIGSNIHNSTIASGVGSQLQIEGNSYQTSSLALINNSTSTDPAFINFGKSRAGSSGGTTIVQNGDRVGGIRWSVADGTDLHSRVAQIDVYVDGAPGSNDTPGKISIQTTPDGSDIPLDRLNIDSAGRVTLGAGTQNQFASSFNSGANQLLITSNGSTGLTIDSTSSTSGSIHFADGSTGSESYRGIIEYNHSEDDMKFAVEGQHVARLRKGPYSDVGGGMIIGSNSSDAGVAHSDSRTLILGHTTHSETGITLVNSSSGSGKIRFSDNTSPYNQGSIAYYHGSRTVGSVPTYADSLTFAPNQKDDQFVMNGNEAMRLSSDNGKMKMVDGFWSKSINTTFQTVFSIQSGYDNSSIHRGYFYEIIVFGGDWGSHSANRTYFKGFINGADTYQGHTVIEHSGTYGSNTGGEGHYGSSQCTIQVTFTGNGNSHIQMKLSTGDVTAEGYARFVGWIRDYDGFEIR